jgi:hypothetical protein
LSEAQYGLFLSVGAYLCAAGAIFNLFKLKKRGNSALILSAAFLVFGAELWLIKINADRNLITTLGILLALLLITDIVLRSRQQEKPR